MGLGRLVGADGFCMGLREVRCSAGGWACCWACSVCWWLFRRLLLLKARVSRDDGLLGSSCGDGLDRRAKGLRMIERRRLLKDELLSSSLGLPALVGSNNESWVFLPMLAGL